MANDTDRLFHQCYYLAAIDAAEAASQILREANVEELLIEKCGRTFREHLNKGMEPERFNATLQILLGAQ